MPAVRILIGLLLAAGLAAALHGPRAGRVMGGYATSLEGRTPGQRSNALRAARQIDGAVIESGKAWSFNDAVGPWTPDRGFVIAPVSYDGELVADWGGGVCQTSTALYNAALLAGLEIAERHRHTWAPRYVPPGRDAAVAQRDIDLRLRNPYPWPVRVRAAAAGDRLAFEILGGESGPMAEVRGESLSSVGPMELIRPQAGRAGAGRRLLTRGRPGARVTVYRTFLRGPRAGSRELVSEDSYPPMNRIVSMPE